MKGIQSLKKKIRPLYRSEQTSLRGLLALRFLTEVNCLYYQIRCRQLKKISVKMLEDLREKKAKNVFVFANGPSLSDVDFAKVKELTESGEFDLITVNSFASKAMRQHGLKPVAGVFADPVYYGERPEHVSEAQFQEDVEIMNQHSVPALTPYRYYGKSRFNTSIPYNGVRNVFSSNVSDMTKPLGYMNLTAFHALSLAIHLKYENIYICGYDNSYFKGYGVDENGEQYFEDRHFYDKNASTKRFLPESEYGPTSYIFYDAYRHFKYLEKIGRHGKAGVNIYNVAKTTYTKAFPRSFDLDIYLEKKVKNYSECRKS